MHHREHDNFSMALAQRIAAGLKEHPEWVDLARSNLDRWTLQNADAPALQACYQEWRSILSLSPEAIVAVLIDPSDRGQRLRQNSPFAGVFSAGDIWRMKRQMHEATSA